ncbi:hypothetical protein BLD50_14495 [Bacillus cereus]|nr:hypothetical protein BLD50_14495 [Bacillus cereus]
MLHKLCLIILLLILGVTLLIVSCAIKSSLLFGLGLGIIFCVLIMWLPDILLWMMKGEFPQEDILLQKNREAQTSLLSFPYDTLPLHVSRIFYL